MLLSGKVIVVTGAESGIGRATADACAEQGANLVLAGLDKGKLAEVATALSGAGREALAVPTDIREAAAVGRLFATAVGHFGRIDGAVANAGIIGARKPAAELSLDDWRQVMDVNLTGTFLTVLEAARILIGQGGGGSIVATGSSTALRPVSGLLPYVASKGGVHALMQSLALELAPYRIRVNTLVPGTTATDATRAMPGYLDQVAKSLPMGEVVDAQELGRYVAFALSDQLPHLTGTHLKIDAGRTI
ncbi:SDR family NAD(P)-dependent oxidoreductase [Bosea sp. 2KB_26]|uniref:SDR family NAD(P)-dependent oxidoreductase n=1 Tax=Bosea sp. 2KB_26 TaxID=3237475 RepID=UPI003F8EFC87